jgi:SAM-dependent methyltransferase
LQAGLAVPPGMYWKRKCRRRTMLERIYINKKRRIDILVWENFRERDSYKSIIPSNEIHLNLGCGENIRDRFLNCDKERIDGLDIILNLDYSLPFKDNSIDRVVLSHIMAHIKHPRKLMKEVDRILKRNCEAILIDCLCECSHRFNPTAIYVKH